MGSAFAAERAWRLDPQVTLRDEASARWPITTATGAWCSSSRACWSRWCRRWASTSAAEAITALVPEAQRDAYRRALARLAASEVIDAR